MPTYKLMYFNARGRAECARMMFAYGGLEYEDVRMDREEWLKLKPDSPFGGMPILEVDGTKFCQSGAIDRYVAKQVGLMGENDIDVIKIEQFCGCIEDHIKPLITVRYEKDEARKAELEKAAREKLPETTKMLHNLIEGPFITGEKMSMADISLTCGIDAMKMLGFPIDLDEFPKFKAVYEGVHANEKIANWVKNRPETNM